MKKIILIVACMGLVATSAFCQDAKSSKTTKKNSSSVKFICPKCNKVYTTGGQCTNDKNKLIKEGNYYCPKCMTQNAEGGICPATNCGTQMVKMVAKP